eukprot:TRINITY_DN23190_c0_g1_i1.p1 TRINITY_DN23190_c0_g1~~TRINITY_DN23190_c0_g1_i1.p1  ORF type:complete len:222 (-),score=26.43 TRINITY_DN23190_c0_g1_i1:91-726(-)
MAWHNGKWWPLYVPQWYHPRVSQHFFDPYSFMHIEHGFIFYGLWGWWPELVWGYTWWWVWIVGGVLNFLAELTHEIIENTPCIIQLFRNNSGTSSEYNGDAWQNIVGDLISCTFGWYVITVACHYEVCQYVIPIWVVTTEIGLLLYMRDSPILVVIQLICPIEAIKKWQAEKVPEDGRKPNPPPRSDPEEGKPLKSEKLAEIAPDSDKSPV